MARKLSSNFRFRPTSSRRRDDTFYLKCRRNLAGVYSRGPSLVCSAPESRHPTQPHHVSYGPIGDIGQEIYLREEQKPEALAGQTTISGIDRHDIIQMA